jgi:dTDP-4-dehydrorhamnose reductase
MTAWCDQILAYEVTLGEAKKLGIPYVFVSKAEVFDGFSNAYIEYSEPNPLSVYGKSK